MASGIYLAMAGSVAQQQALDITANNVANASTAGFRADRMSFQQALAGARKDSTSVRSAGTKTDETLGIVETTGNPLDLALSGEGYLVVQARGGQRLSRGGTLHIDPDGHLETPDGAQLVGQDERPITVPPGSADIAISGDGRVTADNAEVGRLKIVATAPGTLRREGNSLFVPTAPLTAAPQTTQCQTGALEQSNFNVVRGMVDLVRISRTYEALHRMIESYKQIDERSARIGNGG